MTRVIPLGNIVVATEAAPASHDRGAGMTVPAPPSQAGSIMLRAVTTRLGDAPVAPEGLATATIISAEMRHNAQCRGNPAENPLEQVFEAHGRTVLSSCVQVGEVLVGYDLLGVVGQVFVDRALERQVGPA